MNKTSDEELIKRYLQGKERELEFLISRYLKPIYVFIYRRTGNDSEVAQDITQEVFLKMWKNLKRFDQKKKFRTWLFTIAKNACTDFLRKKKSLPFSVFEDGDGNNFFVEGIVDTSSLPAEVFNYRNLSEKFSLAWRNLPAKYRPVFSLRYSKQFTFQEIAETLDKPLNTVKSLYRRGLLKLRKILI